jgi:glycerophosphoryl diester phosphodiesterase
MFDIQGHRGCRGLYPENTIPAFLKAIDCGVTTLELDVVISEDRQVVVSHEAWFSHEISLTPDGQEITEAEERNHNLFRMPYARIREYDCGSKIHPRFPQQQKLKTYKPLLSEMIKTVDNYLKINNLLKVYYNIETKCLPETDGIFHPSPAEFVDLLYEVLDQKNLFSRSIIQSFDGRTLQLFRQKNPFISLSLLVENRLSPQENIDCLGFVPAIYSSDYQLVDTNLISWAKERKVKIIPWTVNEISKMQELKKMGVDGLITDYPDRAALLNDLEI